MAFSSSNCSYRIPRMDRDASYCKRINSATICKLTSLDDLEACTQDRTLPTAICCADPEYDTLE